MTLATLVHMILAPTECPPITRPHKDLSFKPTAANVGDIAQGWQQFSRLSVKRVLIGSVRIGLTSNSRFENSDNRLNYLSTTNLVGGCMLEGGSCGLEP